MNDILTVTLNPALDLSTATDRVIAGPKLRCDPVAVDPGGGGINVARVVQALGGPNGRRVDVYALQVVGHEKNRILLALKSPLQMEKTSAPERLHALRRRLGLAVDHHRMRNTEPTLVATMDSLVETCQRWEIR